jgi:putative two-component system response regulator
MSLKQKPTILCVDDDRLVLSSLKSELRSQLGAEARIETAESGEDALSLVDEFRSEDVPLAVVISDVRMPGMNGDVLLTHIRARCPDTLNILLTGFADMDAITNAVNKAGLFRYIGKPWRRDDLVMTVRSALKTWGDEMLIREKNRAIELLTVNLVTTLENFNMVTDEETHQHIRRVRDYSKVIAEGLGAEDAFVKRIHLYASLHDIGKVGVPREILISGLRYTPEERETMKRHVEYGGRILDTEGIDTMARNVALFHHERWDGKGYVAGLAGEAIPLEARIVAVADVFDAITTERPYKQAFSPSSAVREIKAGSGNAFDPAIVDAFLARLPEIIDLCGCGELELEDLEPSKH